MITIYAEKPDMGTKIAAALDHLQIGTQSVSFDQLLQFESAIRKQRTKDGFFKIHYYGQDVYVTWGFGHLCELKQAYDYNPDYKNWHNLPLPFLRPHYDLKLALSGNSQKDARLKEQYQLLEKLFHKSSELICATDNDREGDLIFDYLYQYMGCTTPFKRAIYNKQSAEEFQKAFSPHALISGEQRKNVIAAGRARSVGDFIVGANMTVAMSLQYPNNGVLSVGRVQTAVLNFPVQREQEIQAFRPQDYFVIKGQFSSNSSSQSYSGIHQSKRITSSQDAQSLLNRLNQTDRQGIVSAVVTKQYSQKKPYLYSLQTLQIEANKKFGLSMDTTLQICQSLYDKEVATYPRTENVHLPEDMVPEMTSVLIMLSHLPSYHALIQKYPLSLSAKNRHYFDDSKVEGHYAIVPTAKDPRQAHLTDVEKKIYDLLVKSVICMLYPDATMSSTKITTDIHGEKFFTSGKTVVNPGYLAVIGIPTNSILPTVHEGDVVQGQFQSETKQTQPPKRYTEASLLNAMLTCGKTIEDEELKQLMAKGPSGKPRGLGRPSSQASIVQTLKTRGYITENGKTILPTQKGMDLIQVLPVDDLKSAVMTAQWEKRLDDIETGTDTYDSFVHDLSQSVTKWVKEIQSTPHLIPQGLQGQTSSFQTDLACPLCGKPLLHFDWGYSCSGYKDKSCSFSVGKIASKKIPDAQVKKLVTSGHTDVIRGFKGKAGKKFNAALKLEQGKIVFDFNATVNPNLLCPNCGKPLRELSWGYGCTGYPDCHFSIGQVCGHKLTHAELSHLLQGKEIYIKRLKSKKGNYFSAYVSWTPEKHFHLRFQ